MSAAYGLLLIAVSVFLTVIARHAAARPQPPFWASDNMIGNVVCPTIVGSLAIGVSLLVRFGFQVAAGEASLTDDAAAVAMLVALVGAVFGWRAMKRKRPLADVVPLVPNSGGTPPTVTTTPRRAA